MLIQADSAGSGPEAPRQTAAEQVSGNGSPGEHGVSFRTVDLTLSFGTRAVLSNIATDFQRSRITALLGPTGSGKSTLLRTFNRMNDKVTGYRHDGDVMLASSGSSSSPSASSSPDGVSLTETGSTLVFPLFGAWQTAYNTDVTDVTITGSGTGSGTGIADAATGTVTMGASDAYLSSSDISQYPGLINIPVAVASLMVNYNVPGIKKPLNLSGKVLAGMYTGKIKTWNDPAIKALNPGQNLPAMKITTLHRAESSRSC
jgi:ABC-type phosphate transport system substrate-binding protein